tara:strand:- start:167 stop:352 length:186 start_codon:yes stop_codon:yes gene_type:complete
MARCPLGLGVKLRSLALVTATEFKPGSTGLAKPQAASSKPQASSSLTRTEGYYRIIEKGLL